MTALVEFEVLGVPAPQGSKTAVTVGGKARVIQAGSKSGREKHRAWRGAVAQAARDVAGDRPHDGPLWLSISFRFPMPKSRPAAARAAGRWPHSVKPDIDKVLRATADGLTDGGLIADDSRICAVECEAWEVDGWTGAVITVGRQALPDRLGATA
jgi:Holliday junction resolvase RusA-like endonuclease